MEKINVSVVELSNISEKIIGISCQDTVDGPLESIAFKTIVYLMYSIVFFIALVGNGLVCYVVMFSSQMRSVTNLFIMNMAVGDLLMTIFCVPFSFVATLILQHWPFGNDLCHTVSFAQAIAVLECGVYICGETWANDKVRHFYSAALLVLQYCIPFAVLLFTYISIGVVVWGKRTPGEAQNSRDARMAKSKRKMIKMMVTVVIAFTICWLPYNILLIIWDHEPSLSTWKGLPYVWFFFHWLAMSHTCYNPLIYCWMNTRYRTGFAAVLSSIPGCRGFLDSYLNSQQHQFRYSHNDASQMEGLHRINTSTSFVSVRRIKSFNGRSCGRNYRTNWHEEKL
ncbi:RYamide receptor-like isoform X3 [Daktulosphaira vitifoliae]|uniref:RYamide receptor-like isoform X3 n=1 Tax=Daktulosphaira vitifoliae TaxID=58002 RepID=UPI0021A9A4F6|nr:RYamide receptor-like isoform X3 [Daktulosphaira vitifoliae]